MTSVSCLFEMIQFSQQYRNQMEANQPKINRVIPESYMHITYEMRKKLIHLVQQEKVTIPQSCRILGIKKSTAKSILRQYRRKGKIFRRKSEKRVSRKKVSEQSGAINILKQPVIPEKEQDNSNSKPDNISQDIFFCRMNQYSNMQPVSYWTPISFYNPFFPNISFGFI